MVYNVRDVVRRLERDGWYLQRTKGSHRQFRHPEKGTVVTVPGTNGEELSVGILRSIFRQAGWDWRTR